jgi:hypothetical protein
MTSSARAEKTFPNLNRSDTPGRRGRALSIIKWDAREPTEAQRA